MADRSTDARGEAAARPQPPAPPEAARPSVPRDDNPAQPPDEAEADKARTEIAAGDVADDLADFA